MEIVYCPPGMLPGADVVECFGYRAEAVEPLVRRVAPTGAVKLIFRFGDPLRSATGTSRPVPGAASAFVVGLKDRPGVTVHAGSVDSLQVLLSPLGAYRVLGVPVGSLRGAAFDLADVVGPRVDRLVERLTSAGGWEARFRLLSRILGERLAVGPQPDPAVGWAWRRLRASGGRLPVGELAAEVGMSRRHLSRRFNHQVGLSPKSLARVLRFRRAVRLGGSGVSWSRVAAECGYYDQPHLVAEFQVLAGCAPTEFVRRRDGLVLPV